MAALTNQHYFPDNSIFGYIQPRHPVHQQVRSFESQIHQNPAYSEYTARQQKGLATEIHAEIKLIGSGDSRHIERFYYSIQFPAPELPGGFYAWSLHYSLHDGITKIYEFPNDPKLFHLASFINCPDNREVKILRYVPLRRVTFLRHESYGKPAVIGKLKKPRRSEEAYRKLVDVAEIANPKVCRTPQPQGLNSNESVFYQQLVPGIETGPILNNENYCLILTEIGKLHGELGKWPISQAKPWDRDGVMKNLWRDLDDIKFFLPETESFLSKVCNWLKQWQRNLAAIPKTFCHGDFACSQILHHDLGWSIVDFDLAGLGDPYQDMAMFLVSLSHDVVLFHTQPELLPKAYTAYLEGHQIATDNMINNETFIGYLICAEIYYLALILKKNRFTTLAFERTLERLRTLTGLT